MATIYEAIDGRLRDVILAQKVFFVATAPSTVDGHVNLSPKGMTGSFVVLDPLRVAYLDYTGSGAETIAHLRENGRIVLMFCAFEGPPTIIRLHGRGRSVLPEDPGFGALMAAFASPPYHHGLRSVIEVEVTRVSDSCGWAVPQMTYEADRDILRLSHERKSDEDLVEYWANRNKVSIDGLPALR